MVPSRNLQVKTYNIKVMERTQF